MAASVVSVPANEGISVKDEPDDPEIDAMAIKMKENFQKSIATARQQSVTNIYINRAGRPVALNIYTPSSNSSKDTENLPQKDTEDYPSERGLFGWEEIGTCQVPYILRKINGENVRYVAVRIAENQLLQKYLHFLHQDIYSCTCVRSHFISEYEAKVLNEINNKHSENLYGKEPFCVGKDFIVLLEDVKEFYAFLETCYKKLLCNIAPGRRERCGFIRINSESVVPYCIKENHKYVPLFYFEGETDNLRHRAIKLENWHLAYLKFCCKVQGIRNELFASDSCTVTSLDDIKNYFPPDTVFEEYWPAKVVDTQLLTNAKTATYNTPGSWIRIPHPSENPYAAVAAAAASASAVVQTPTLPPPPSMPIWPSTPNQMINTSSYNPQSQQLPPPSYPTVTRNQSAAVQYYNSNPTLMHQGNTPINNVAGHAPPPPLVRAGLQQPVPIVNSGSYSNGSINSTSMYSPSNSNVSHSSQGRQFYGAPRSSSVVQVQQQQQQPMINQSQQSYGAQSLLGGNTNTRMGNNQQRNILRNATLTVPPSEIIDLSSPPPSPPPQQDLSRTNNTQWTLKRIPENSAQWQQNSNGAAYKIQKATLQGKVLYCINSRPFIYSDLMLTLDDLVQSVFPTSSVATVAQFLQKYLKTTLYSGNSEQMAVLRENGRLRSLFPDDTPLAMLQDVTHVFLQLKSLIAKQDEQIQPYQTNGPSKRQRTS
ncbi:Hypothetical protein CINCED_3A006315 [Cinara cedri]|uniref:Uncharacterized protein n=1 Tax=Cinara cedri TaxID=506608 RepID=A0A5E4M0P5_9HEMI|nr:Hypothetical protein CINCED_3A006315 [Cinara cedri]